MVKVNSLKFIALATIVVLSVTLIVIFHGHSSSDGPSSRAAKLRAYSKKNLDIPESEVLKPKLDEKIELPQVNADISVNRYATEQGSSSESLIPASNTLTTDHTIETATERPKSTESNQIVAPVETRTEPPILLTDPPTVKPTAQPTVRPTSHPTSRPTSAPTEKPTRLPPPMKFDVNTAQSDDRFESLLSFYDDYVHEILREEKDREAKLMEENSQKLNQSSADISIVQKFHDILRTGSVCEVSDDSSTLSKTISDVLVSTEVHYDTLFELTSKRSEDTIAMKFAPRDMLLTTIHVKTRDPTTNAVTLNDDDLVGPGESSRLDSSYNKGHMLDLCDANSRPSNFLAVESLSSLSRIDGNFNCLQVIHDIREIVNGKLHFEFEEFFGRLLCRCSDTVLPKELPNVPYFSYWDTLPNLVKSSLKTIDDANSCVIEIDPTSLTSVAYYKIKYTHTILHRNTTVQHDSSWTLDKLLSIDLDTQSIHRLFSSMNSFFNAEMSTSVVSNITSLNRTSALGSLLLHGSVVSDVEVVDLNKLRKTGSQSRRAKNRRHMVSTSEPATDASASAETANGLSLSSSSSSSHSTHFTEANRIANSHSNSNSNSLKSSNVTSDTPDANNNNETSSESISVRRRLSDKYYFSSSKTMGKFLNDIGPEVDHTNTWLGVLPKSSDSLDDLGEFDHPDLNQDATSSNDALISSSFSSNAWNSKLFPDKESRKQQAHRQEVEYNEYQKWISVLKMEEKALNSLGAHDLIYVFGSYSSFLSVKLSKMILKASSQRSQKFGIVVSHVSDRNAINAHLRLISSQGIANNIVTHADMSLQQWVALLMSPERADMAIYQNDLVIRLISQAIHKTNDPANFDIDFYQSCGARLVDEVMSTFVVLSNVGFVELPATVVLHALFAELSSPRCAQYLSDRYPTSRDLLISGSTSVAANGYVSIEFLSKVEDATNRPDHISEVARVEFHSKDTVSLERNLDQPVPFWEKTSSRGVSYYTLLHLGTAHIHKRQMFQLLLDLPLWSLPTVMDADAVRPWNIFVTVGKSSGTSMKKAALIWNIDYRDHEGSLNNPLHVGVSVGSDGISPEIVRSKILWSVIRDELKTAEVAMGKFSFVEHNSGFGYISARLAKTYPNATVISLERDSSKVAHHQEMVSKLGLMNNAICEKTVDDDIIFKNTYESPELFRFQLVSRGLLESFVDSGSLDDWGTRIGEMLSTALTTFVSVPTSVQVSYAATIMFGGVAGTGALRGSVGPYRSHRTFENDLDRTYRISSHPMPKFANFEAFWLLGNAKVRGGETRLSLTPLKLSTSYSNPMMIPLVRCDIVHMLRHVHHHYDYSKDGHSRTYTMHVDVNDTYTSQYQSYFKFDDLSSLHTYASRDGMVARTKPVGYIGEVEETVLPLGAHIDHDRIVTVQLYRDKDSWPIPYTSIYGITLISVLRMGLIESHRERYFGSFLSLPLYEDMAPWNIVLMGQAVDYIDYDTRDFTFDRDVPKTYQVMAVLMNYKRTVEDFKRCGSKASTVYGLPFVSDCVGSNIKSPSSCPDLKQPVPCGDGTCHSDYISCLRAVSNLVDSVVNTQETKTAVENSHVPLSWTFDDKGLKYER